MKELHKVFSRYVILFTALNLFGFLLLWLSETSEDLFDCAFTALSCSTLTGFVTINLSELSAVQQLLLLAISEGAALLQVAFFISLYSVVLKREGILIPKSFNGALLISALFLFILQIIGFGAIFAFAGTGCGSLSERAYFAFYHSIAISIHSGLSYLPGGVTHPLIAKAFLLQLVLAVIILAGAVGYVPFKDILSIKRLRERIADSEKNWLLHTRYVLFGSMGVVMFCTVFFIWQADGLKMVEAGINGFFNATAALGSGYLTLDYETFTPTVNVAFIVAVFVFGLLISPYSPGGILFSNKAKVEGKLSSLLKFVALCAGFFLVFFILLKLFDTGRSFSKQAYLSAASLMHTGNSAVAIEPGAGSVLLMFNMLAGWLLITFFSYRFTRKFTD